MSQPGSKLFIITTMLFAVISIVLFALSVTSLAKYKGQKQRVHHLEEKMLAGKKEMLKVPEMIGRLRVTDKAKAGLEVEVTDLTESNGELTSEVAGLQKENTILTVAKAVLEMDKSGYTKNLVEARQAVEELRQSISTNDGGSFIGDDLFNEASSHIHMEVSHPESSTEHAEVEHHDAVSNAGGSLTELQRTLNSMQKILESPHFLFLRSDERAGELNSLIARAEKQSEATPSAHQLIKDFAEKVASDESTVSEMIDSLGEAQAGL